MNPSTASPLPAVQASNPAEQIARAGRREAGLRVILPLARDVSRFDLRYLDPQDGEWQDSWDTNGADTPGRLPRAVQIVLTIAKTDPDDDDEVIERTFVTTVTDVVGFFAFLGLAALWLAH